MPRLLANANNDSRKVADKWSATEYDPAATFFGFPPLRPYRIRLAFGEQEVQRYKDEPQWPELLFVDKYLSGRRIETVLSLCCGFGHVERMIVQRLGTVRHCLALDVAAGAVAEARRRAERAGLGDVLRYEVADLNHHALPVDAYDLVIANGALHHLSNLEGVLSGIRRALHPGGILYANEHVGASLQDYPPRQIELINAVAYLIPTELRSRRPAKVLSVAWALPPSLHEASDLLRGWTRPAAKKVVTAALRFLLRPGRRPQPAFPLLHGSRKKHLLRTDPSEGVRSAEIIPLMRAYFASVEIHPYGGAVLAYALDSAFYRGFNPQDRRHVELLRLLCELEEHLTDSGEVGLEHAIMIATK